MTLGRQVGSPTNCGHLARNIALNVLIISICAISLLQLYFKVDYLRNATNYYMIKCEFSISL